MVAVDKLARRNAKPIETLAIFDPRVKQGETQKTVQWSVERIRYWLKHGAEPTESVIKLLNMVCCNTIYLPAVTDAPPGWHNKTRLPAP